MNHDGINHEGTKAQRHKEAETESCLDSSVPDYVEHLATQVIGATIEVHQAIGPGFPESVYEHAVSLELDARGLVHRRQAPITIYYRGSVAGEGRIDILVNNCLVLELKTADALADVHRSQVVAYLKATNLRLGLLINFHQAVLKDGVRRIIN